MSPNVNPETGIRYGIIATNTLNSDTVNDILQRGTDPYLEDELKSIRREIEAEAAEGDFEHLPDWDIEEEVRKRQDAFSEDYNPEEPCLEFDIAGVKGQTTWLGGAQLVWVFFSPHISKALLCSPCVPNCGDLDNLDESGYECYDVPPDWRVEEGK